MKVVILAGGYGTRISEESHLRPKPMIEIGGRPVLWHIMKIYSAQGFHDFVICLGYKGHLIKEYFANYFFMNSDVTFSYKNGAVETTYHTKEVEPWSVTLVDTGLDTMTGGRIKRIETYVDGDTFLCTYGDGLANVEVSKLVDFHRTRGGVVTITAAKPSGRFGALSISDTGQISSFREKHDSDEAWVNAGFFVCDRALFSVLKDDTTILERDPFNELAEKGKLFALEHSGFWQPMDTVRDRAVLEELWSSGTPPWKIW